MVTKSENARNKRFKDLIGDQYGRLVVVSENEKKRNEKGRVVRILNCKCSCGNFKDVQFSSLISGNTKSCGCIKKEILTERNKNAHRKTV